jgi:hypothetical protein
VLPDLAPGVRCLRDAEHVPEGHGDLEPGQVAGGLGAGREHVRGVGQPDQVQAGALLNGWAGVYQSQSLVAEPKSQKSSRHEINPERIRHRVAVMIAVRDLNSGVLPCVGL